MRKIEYAATAYVLDQSLKQLLFIRREKPPYIGWYLPPGGHIERGETPDQAVLREVEEETGYTIRLLAPPWGRDALSLEEIDEQEVRIIPPPLHIQLEPIDESHDHLDFIFLAQVEEKGEKVEKAKKEGVWLQLNDIKKKKEMPKNVQMCAQKILENHIKFL